MWNDIPFWGKLPNPDESLNDAIYCDKLFDILDSPKIHDEVRVGIKKRLLLLSWELIAEVDIDLAIRLYQLEYPEATMDEIRFEMSEVGVES